MVDGQVVRLLKSGADSISKKKAEIKVSGIKRIQ
jgi:hypothetical protein